MVSSLDMALNAYLNVVCRPPTEGCIRAARRRGGLAFVDLSISFIMLGCLSSCLNGSFMADGVDCLGGISKAELLRVVPAAVVG